MSIDKTGAAGTDPTEEKLRSVIADQETKLAEITELVMHVRHEINNPLTGVIGQAQLLLREELSPSAKRRVETINQLAARIKDTVAHLRNVQRQPQKLKQVATETEDPPLYGKARVKDGSERMK